MLNLRYKWNRNRNVEYKQRTNSTQVELKQRAKTHQMIVECGCHEDGMESKRTWSTCGRRDYPARKWKACVIIMHVEFTLTV